MTVYKVELTYTEEELQACAEEFMARFELAEVSKKDVKAALVKTIAANLETQFQDMLKCPDEVFRKSEVEKHSRFEFEYAADHPEEVIAIAA